jgi:D-aspartate ligase
MYKNRLVIVFAIDHYNPLGAIRSLGENGIRPIYIAIRHRVELGVKSKYVSKVHQVDSVEEGYKVLMENYGEVYKTGEKPFVLFSDDKSVGYFDTHYDEVKDCFITYNANNTQGRIMQFMDKKNILDLAKKHGLNVLDSYVCNKGEIPEGLVYPVITKDINPNAGGWKSDVFVCNSEEELKAAYEKISSPVVLLQRYIEKKTEIAFEGCSVNKGQSSLIAIESTYKYAIPAYYSPFMTCKSLHDEKLKASLEGMLAEIGFEGIFEIEFLVDKNDEKYFLEINFRNATWSYASTRAGMPLPYIWVKGMLNGKIDKDDYKEVPGGFTAMVEPIDYAKRLELGLSNPWEWLADFKKADCGFYYSEDDLEPFYEMVRNWDKLS